MIKAVVVGYGNIGKSAIEAVVSASDFELVGVVRRNATPILELPNVQVVSDVNDLKVKPDLAILCTPTRQVEESAKVYLELGINTVDSYDIHGSIWDLRQQLDSVAKANKAVAVVSSGWDPGSDSCVRIMMEAIAPKGITYTNFGPGMSMGHSVAVRAIDGVNDALSITIPLGTGIHRRMVYVEIKDGYKFDTVKETILNDEYFKHDETHVVQVPDVSAVADKGHGVNMVRKGVSGITHNQNLEFNMSINNPAATAQIMVCCGRAALQQASGAYTMVELPLINLLEGSLEDKIKRLV